jgi:ParB family transcriptional regulator, chromosome partitioning protein
MKRKDELKALFLQSAAPEKQDDSAKEGTTSPPPRQTASAVRTMGLDLRALSDEADRARKLKDQIEAGLAVVEVDPDAVDESFVADRLVEQHDPSFDLLIESIRVNGQLVPILVRPNPDKTDSYQLAYGHRRLRAMKVLGGRVRAIVKEMTDAEMVVAQGKENSERRDLSFIERALFAQNLEDRGFPRAVAMAALSVDKTELARLLAVARAIPLATIQAIGPAPKAGRTRWMALAGLLSTAENQRKLDSLVATEEFKALESNRRFERVWSILANSGKHLEPPDYWSDARGRRIVRIERSLSRMRLTFDEKLEPTFGAYVRENLGRLLQEFRDRTAQTES